jgi:Mn-containing catalase
MSQEIVRPSIVNQLQDLLPSRDDNEIFTDVITLYPYLDDTDAINTSISREFAYLLGRENKRRQQFLEAVKHLGYSSTTAELTMQANNSEAASEKGIDDNDDTQHTNDSGDLHIITKIDKNADARPSDDVAEQAFREYIKELNSRPVMQLELATIIPEAYESEPESVNDGEVQPVELTIKTNDIMASEEVIREIRALIEATETKSRIKNGRFRLLSLLGIVE